jgi:endonuclease III
LLSEYPPGHPARPTGPKLDPLGELVFTVLSQNTSDVNRDRAWVSLRKAYPSWADALAATPAALARSIAVGGLSNIKAPRIHAILRAVLEREGRFSLASLKRLSDAEAVEYLLSLPGVGAKTAACVLAFSLGRDRLPVDTHVHRVTTRLGLAATRATPERAQEQIEAVVPHDRVETHVALIAHGRSVCRAQRPLCGDCVLFDLCPAGPSLIRT